MPSRLKTLALTIPTCLAFLALAEGVAVAHDVAFNSRATLQWQDRDLISDGGITFSGRVTSDTPGCIASRTVKVFRVVGNSSVPDTLVSNALTNTSGDWPSLSLVRTGGPNMTGTYYARVWRKDLRPGSAAHDHVCRADNSPNLQVLDLNPVP